MIKFIHDRLRLYWRENAPELLNIRYRYLILVRPHPGPEKDLRTYLLTSTNLRRRGRSCCLLSLSSNNQQDFPSCSFTLTALLNISSVLRQAPSSWSFRQLLERLWTAMSLLPYVAVLSQIERPCSQYRFSLATHGILASE